MLNPKIVGWSNYFKTAVSSQAGSVSKVEMDCDCCHTGPRLCSLHQEGMAHDVHRGPLSSLPE